MPFPYSTGWPAKSPDAILDYNFDFTSWLATGETLSSATITVPTGITLYQAGEIVGSTVVFWLSGGSANQSYPVTCSFTTSAGRSDSRTSTLNCQTRTI